VPDYSVTVTDYQQLVLEWLVRQLNTERGTSITVAQFLQSQIPEQLRPFELRFEDAMAAQVASRYKAADAALKATVRDTLGVE
jgi:hypothetical protein